MFGRDNIYVYETEYTEGELEIIHRRNSARTDLEGVQVESSFRTDTTSYTVEQLLKKENNFITLLNEIDDKRMLIEDKIMNGDRFHLKEEILQEIAEWKN
jgi:hypothetical protein